MHIWDINQAPREQILAAIEAISRGGRGPFVFPHRLASGEVREVEVHSGPIEVGGRRYLHSLIFDVTERRRTEAALRESEERYRRLVEHSPLAIVVCTEERCSTSTRRACACWEPSTRARSRSAPPPTSSTPTPCRSCSDRSSACAPARRFP